VSASLLIWSRDRLQTPLSFTSRLQTSPTTLPPPTNGQTKCFLKASNHFLLFFSNISLLASAGQRHRSQRRRRRLQSPASPPTHPDKIERERWERGGEEEDERHQYQRGHKGQGSAGWCSDSPASHHPPPPTTTSHVQT
jgi:hypothetical protein